MKLLSIINARFCAAVVLPPPPGEDGEIYDDIVDPNLEVRWEFSVFTSGTEITQMWPDGRDDRCF